MTDDPSFDLAAALTNDPRSFRAIADAILSAADLDPDETTPVDRAGHLTRGLVERYMLIDQISVTRALMALVGFLAQRSGRTPRQVHEELFKAAPDDRWWNDRIGREP